MSKLRKLTARFMLLGAMCIGLGLTASNSFAEKPKWECQNCEYVTGGLELCQWNKPPSGICGEKPANAVCFPVESCPPIDPE